MAKYIHQTRSETLLRSDFSELLRRQGAIVIPQVATKYGVRGVPDKYVSHRKWRGFIEEKKQYYDLEPHQSQMIDLLAKSGSKVAVLYFLDKPNVDGLTLPPVNLVVYWYSAWNVNKQSILTRSWESVRPDEVLDLLSKRFR